MQRATILFFAFIIMCFSHDSYGQYLPIGAMPMEYNPSFAGSVGNSRIASNVSYYNSNFMDGYNVLYSGRIDLSYDNYFPSIRSGVGVAINQDYHVQNIDDSPISKIWSTDIDLILAPKISLKGKYTISPSIGFKYMSRYGWHDHYQDMVSKDGFAMQSGLLFNTSHYYIGYAIEYTFNDYYHYNSFGFSGLISAVQFGYTFQKSVNSDFSFTPQLALPILFSSGIGVYWPSYILSFRYKNLIVAATSQFEYSYPTGFQIGWQNKGWRILFSNDFSERNDFVKSYDANLSLRYIFNRDKKSKHILNSIY